MPRAKRPRRSGKRAGRPRIVPKPRWYKRNSFWKLPIRLTDN